MNKHFYRVIFNAARGLRMVVQESARSAGKSTTSKRSSGLGVALAALLGMAVAPTTAQIVGASNVPGDQRPTVLTAPNGVPLINIQTPSAAGVSRNVYSQFDVQANGAILNNSRSNVQTQLGGWVQGNPWLATGPARVILNEVNSGHPSQLRGYVEVGGQRAEVVIANPAGIAVDGGGFINASRVTLTTGVPQLGAFGGLDSFRVSGGNISVDGKGLDLSQSDYAGIYARAVQVNAGIWAKELQVVTGANAVGAEAGAVTPAPIASTGSAPSFALDVAALGGMYANKITLIGTEAGLGVRNAGNIGASAGTLVVTAAGRLENSGTLEGQSVQVNAVGDIDNRGGTIRQSGTAPLAIAAATLSNTQGAWIGAEPVATGGGDSGNAGGGIDSGGSGTGSGTSGGSGGASGSDSGSGTAVTPIIPEPGFLTSTSAILNDGGAIYAGGPISLQTPHLINSGGNLSLGSLTLHQASFSNAGGTLNISGAFTAQLDNFDNSGGTLRTGSLSLHTNGDGVNEGGTLSSTGAMQLDIGGQLNNRDGTVLAGTELDVRAAALNNTAAGSLRATGNATLNVAGSAVNQGSITTGGNLNLSAHSFQGDSASVLGAGIKDDGSLGAAGDLRLTSAQALVAQGVQIAAGTLSLQGGSVDLSGPLSSTSATDVNVVATQGDINVRSASLSASSMLRITADTDVAQSLMNDGGHISADQLDLKLSNLRNQNAAQLVQSGSGATRIAVTHTLSNTDQSTIASNANAMQVSAGSLINSTGSAIEHAGTGNFALEVGSLSNAQARIVSNGNLALQGGALNNDSGVLSAQGLSIDAASLSNQAGLLVQNGNAQMRVVLTGNLRNDAGTLASQGDLTVLADQLSNRGGTVVGQTGVDLQTGALNNDAGLIESKAALRIDTHGQALINSNAAGYAQGSNGSNGQGGLTSGSTLSLNTGRLDNSAGLISSGGALTADTGALTNANGGAIVSLESLRVDTHGASYSNVGGQTLALGDLSLVGDSIDNSGALIRSGANVSLKAHSVTNAATLGTDQGIEAAGDLSVAADTLNNASGAMRTNQKLRITSAGVVNNSAGLLSAQDTLSIVDPNAANPSAKSLSLTNTNGSLLADQGIVVDAARFSGDGTVSSGGDVSIALTQDLINNGQVTSSGNLRYVTTGNLTNNGKLSAGQTLTVGAGDVTNNASGELSGDTTLVNATGSLTNRGLIDGSDTQINASTLNNIGTGRIYGDQLSIAVDTLNNDSEMVAGEKKSATIAARSGLDIGVGTLNNREGALILSMGDLRIGGALDANRMATGRANVITNGSAKIESIGNMVLAATSINNLNNHFSTAMGAPGPATHITQYQLLPGSETLGNDFTTRWDSSQILLVDCEATCAVVIDPSSFNTHSDSFYRFELDQRQSETVVTESAPGQILAGGSMALSADQIRNDKSQILAGGDLNATVPVQNIGAEGQRITTSSGTVTSYWREFNRGRDNSGTQTMLYVEPPVVETFELAVTEAKGNQSIAAPEKKPDALSNLGGGGGASATGSVNSSGHAGAIVEVNGAAGSVASNGSGAQELPMVVRTSAPNTRLPTASLFQSQPNGRYLIETDPRFANYRNWLSSDYLLQALGQDPANVQKRLGDGFYEQQLVREQVAQLTGYRYLDGFGNDQEQYTALMNAGATFAKAYGLTPGVALSAAQMAQLTSDIVWLVEQTVTLPDGTTQQVLVPQVYVRVRPGDIDGTGTLLSADRLILKNQPGQGDFNNSGTMAGRSLVSITADNINNLGGRISGGNVTLDARKDINVTGGTVDARDKLELLAGHDINIRSTTVDSASANGTRTGIDRVAGVYVTNPGGTLVASAKNDVNVLAGILGSNGDLQIHADNNVNLGTVKTAQTNNVQFDSANWHQDASSAEVGSQLSATGDVRITAGNDIKVRASSVNAGQALGLGAGNDLTIEAGERTLDAETASKHTSKGFLSSRTITTFDSSSQTQAIGSSLGGDSVTLVAGNDLTVRGSEVVSDSSTRLKAGNNVTIEAAQDRYASTSEREDKTNGLFSSGGIGVTIGTRKQELKQDNSGTTTTASTVGSIGGDVTIVAGNLYRQTGSDVLAPGGDIDISAKKVEITEARETSRSVTEQKFSQSGLTVALTGTVISAVQSIAALSEASKNTSSTRMQALAAAGSALEAKNALTALENGQKPVDIKDSNGKVTGTREPTADEQAGGINVSISIGASKSESTTTQTSDSARGSTLTAGGDIRIRASGAGADSSILIQGSDLTAGNNASLKADGDITVQAAQNTASLHGENKSASGAIGVSFGTSGIGVTVSASAGRGNQNGDDLLYSNSHIQAGNKINLESGGDTTLKGAVIKADRVEADIGGNLLIESLQDQSTYASKQQNIGGSLTVGVGVSGSLSYSQSKINSDYASVSEQSGIKAGDGGFDVKVKGSTDLKGGVIASNEEAVQEGKNSFETASLTTSDIQNRANYKGSSIGVSVGTSLSQDGKLAPQGTGAGIGSDSGNANSTTQAGISGIAGNTAVRSTDGETGIGKIFDADKVQKDIDAQVTITQTFGREASKAVGDYAAAQLKAAEKLREEARNSSDPQQAEQLNAKAEELVRKWGDQGTMLVLFHSLIGGLTGGVAGAAGAAVGTLTAPAVAEALLNADVDSELAKIITAAASTAAGAAVGGTAGAMAAGNEVANNYLKHDEAARLEQLKDKRLVGRCDSACELEIKTLEVLDQSQQC